MAEVNTKGLLFTLSTIVIVTTIFVFGYIIFESSMQSTDRLFELTLLDRIDDIDSSLQYSINKIIDVKSGIDIEVSGYNITFAEYLNNTNATEFNSSMSEFHDFVVQEANRNLLESITSLTISELQRNLSFLIMPQNILYTHQYYGGKDIAISDPSNNVGTFKISMKTEENISRCKCYSNIGAPTGNNVYFNISLDDLDNVDFVSYVLGGTCCDPGLYDYRDGIIYLEGTLDYNDEFTLELQNSSGLGWETRYIFNYTKGNLYITNNYSKNAFFETVLELDPTTEKPFIRTYDKIINTSFTRFNFSKYSYVALIS